MLAFFDLGNVLDELNRMEESIAAYRQAVSLSPNYADAHYNLALALERKGELRQALRHWRIYLRIDRKQGPELNEETGNNSTDRLIPRAGNSITSAGWDWFATRRISATSW